MKARLVLLWIAALLLMQTTGAIAADAPADTTKKRVLEIGKWYPKLETGANLTQSTYSDNWKGGDTGSIAWSAYMNGLAEKQLKESLNWLNTIKLLYGQTREQHLDASGTRHWAPPEKSSDEIAIESILRLTKGWGIDPYASVRLETLFQDVTDPYGRKQWFNPVTLRESAGISRKIIDHENHQFLARLGLSAREGFRKFYIAPVGDETDSQSAWDSGAELVFNYLRAFNPSFTYLSRASFYQPFNWSKKDSFDTISPDSLVAAGIDKSVADYTTTMDIEWENTFSAKVTKLIQVQLYVEFLYDKYDNTVVPVVDETGTLTNADAVRTAVRKQGQFKQTLGLGVVWNIK